MTGTTEMIHTARLTLIALTPSQLGLCLTRPGDLEAELRVSGVRALRNDSVDRAIGIKLRKLAVADEDDHAWFTYWLVVTASERASIGFVGFKGVPDGDGEVEIGYGVAPASRDRGYATEAVQALVDWAFEEPSFRSVKALLTKTSHPASQRVLEKAGLRPGEETSAGRVWRLARAATL